MVTLLREVRQLSSLGFTIPSKIQQTANMAQKFYHHGVILKQVQWVVMKKTKKTPECMCICADKLAIHVLSQSWGSPCGEVHMYLQ